MEEAGSSDRHSHARHAQVFEAVLPFRAGAQPMRTCVGCRRRETQSHLLRMVRKVSAAGDIAAEADPRHRLPGRGAWLHPTTACLALALKRRAIGRALPGASDFTAVVDYIAPQTGAASAEMGNELSNLKAGQKTDGNPMSTQR